MRRLALILVVASALLGSPCVAQINPGEDDPDLDGVPGLAPPPAYPQPDVPSVLTTTGRLLIDHSHHGPFFFNVSGFTNFIASQGWVIAVHATGPITPSILAGYDILLVPIVTGCCNGINPFSPSEIAAVQSFLQAGGGLWVPNDNSNPTGINTLAQAFGVTFKYDYIQDPTNNEQGKLYWPTIYDLSPHPIIQGVESYGLYSGDCLVVTSPAAIVGRADIDAYSLYCPAGSRPPTLAVWEGAGRAVFAGDITPLHPNYYPSLLRPEEKLLLQNIVNWLMGDSPTATSPTSWGRVKSLYSSSGD